MSLRGQEFRVFLDYGLGDGVDFLNISRLVGPNSHVPWHRAGDEGRGAERTGS